MASTPRRTHGAGHGSEQIGRARWSYTFIRSCSQKINGICLPLPPQFRRNGCSDGFTDGFSSRTQSSLPSYHWWFETVKTTLQLAVAFCPSNLLGHGITAKHMISPGECTSRFGALAGIFYRVFKKQLR